MHHCYQLDRWNTNAGRHEGEDHIEGDVFASGVDPFLIARLRLHVIPCRLGCFSARFPCGSSWKEPPPLPPTSVKVHSIGVCSQQADEFLDASRSNDPQGFRERANPTWALSARPWFSLSFPKTAGLEMWRLDVAVFTDSFSGSIPGFYTLILTLQFQEASMVLYLLKVRRGTFVAEAFFTLMSLSAHGRKT